MSYVVSWDGPSVEEPDRGREVEVSTVEELDMVLDQVHRQAAEDGVAYAVQIHRPTRHGAIMIGVGHPDRSFVDWLDRSQPHGTGNRYAVDPDVEPADAPVAFDVYGDWTELPPVRTRIAAAQAREAARHYLRTGEQPPLHWLGG